jgi:hypothetical protein
MADVANVRAGAGLMARAPNERRIEYDMVVVWMRGFEHQM